MSQRNNNTEIILGIVLLLGMHPVALCLLYLLVYLVSIISRAIPTPLGTYLSSDYGWLVLFLVPGLTQLFYVIPVVFWFRRQQQWGLMKGVIIGAVITALLNGGCFLLLSIGSR